jgi:hypothetical protein
LTLDGGLSGVRYCIRNKNLTAGKAQEEKESKNYDFRENAASCQEQFSDSYDV